VPVLVKLLLVAIAIAVLNVPFGYWRAGVRKFGPAWFAAVHLPIPLALAMRFAVGLGFRLSTLPVFIVAYFGGQFVGARLRPATAPEPAEAD
jgi:hypothetical protein